MNPALLGTLLAMLPPQAHAKTVHNPAQLFDPAPYGFSHVTSVPPGGRLVFVAGQGGEEDRQGKLTPDFRTQVRQALRNVQTALRSQGVEMSAVVKVTTLVVDHDAAKLQVIIEEFERMWPARDFPVNTLVPVPRLALDGMLVEIDAVAVAGAKPPAR